MINPFIKFKGLEFFGNLEFVNGQNKNETEDRDFTQIAAEVLYRFGKHEDFYLGGRYNTVEGRLQGGTEDITINRIQLGGGWFLTEISWPKLNMCTRNMKTSHKMTFVTKAPLMD